MTCTAEDLLVATRVCQGILACSVSSSENGGLALAEARHITIYPEEPADIFVHAAYDTDDFTDTWNSTNENVIAPFLPLPLKKINLDGDYTGSIDSASRQNIYAATCTPTSNPILVSIALLPYYRTVASSWFGGIWVLVLPLLILPFFLNPEKPVRITTHSLVRSACASDALLWFTKACVCAYLAPGAGTNTLIPFGFGIGAALLASAAQRGATGLTKIFISIAGLGTGFFYTSTILSLIWLIK